MAQDTVLATDSLDAGRVKVNGDIAELYARTDTAANVAALRALTSTPSIASGEQRYLKGYYSQGDGGQGLLYYDSATSKSFTATAVDDTFTSTAHGFTRGQQIVLSGGSLPTGASAGVTYYAVPLTTNTFQLSTSPANCLANTPVVLNITADGSGTVDLADNGGTVFVDAASRRWRRVLAVPLQGRKFGMSPTATSATNKAALQSAIMEATTGLAVATGKPQIRISTGDYNIDGGIYQALDVSLIGDDITKTVLDHGSDDVFITADRPSNFDHAPTWKDLSIDGNAGTSAQGLILGDCDWFVLDGVKISGYHNGTGLRMRNTVLWSEHGRIISLFLSDNKRGWVFENAGGGNQSSWSDLRVYHAVINATSVSITNPVHIEFGANTRIYAGNLNLKYFLEMSNAIGLNMNGSAAKIEQSHVNILVEDGSGDTTRTALRMVAGSQITGHGSIYRLGNPGLDLDRQAKPYFDIAPGAYFRLDGELAQNAMGTLFQKRPNGVSTVYRKVGTLPASTGSYADKLEVELVGGPGITGSSMIHDRIIFSNRSGFGYVYGRWGADGANERANVRVQAYTQADNSCEIWVRGAPSVSFQTMVRAFGYGGVLEAQYMQLGVNTNISTNSGSPWYLKLGLETTTTPTGTLAFDSGTYSPNAPGSTTMGSASATGVGADNGDASVTLTSNSARYQKFSTTLTANRTITLPTVTDGDRFVIVRNATTPGAFTLAVGSVYTIAASQKARVEIIRNAGAWELAGVSTWT